MRAVVIILGVAFGVHLLLLLAHLLGSGVEGFGKLITKALSRADPSNYTYDEYFGKGRKSRKRRRDAD